MLRATTRDLPENAGEERVPRYNLDHVWIGADEVDRALPAELAVGDAVEWPALAERLARLHLVDSALGQTLPYAPEEVQQARLNLRVRSVEDGAALLEIVAHTRTNADGVWRLGDNDWKPEAEWPRSMAVKLLGTARFDLTTRRFAAFDVVGIGTWTGKTQFNGRRGRTRGRLGFVFELAPDVPSERVAPAFVEIYDTPWMADQHGGS